MTTNGTPSSQAMMPFMGSSLSWTGERTPRRVDRFRGRARRDRGRVRDFTHQWPGRQEMRVGCVIPRTNGGRWCGCLLKNGACEQAPYGSLRVAISKDRIVQKVGPQYGELEV